MTQQFDGSATIHPTIAETLRKKDGTLVCADGLVLHGTKESAGGGDVESCFFMALVFCSVIDHVPDPSEAVQVALNTAIGCGLLPATRQ